MNKGKILATGILGLLLAISPSTAATATATEQTVNTATYNVISGQELFEQGLIKHRTLQYTAAIKDYYIVLNSPDTDLATEALAQKNLEAAKSKQADYGPNDYAREGLNLIKAGKPYEALKVLEEGYLIFRTPSILQAINESGKVILNWSLAGHNQGIYSAALTGYNTIINSSYIDVSIKNVASRNAARANSALGAYDAKTYLQEGNALLSQSKPYEALALFSEGYKFFQSKELLDGIQRSAAKILSWSLSSHSAGNYSTAIHGYSVVLGESNVQPMLIKMAQRNKDRAAKGQPAYGAQDYIREGNQLIARQSPYEALALFSEGYTFFKDKDIYSGIAKSSNTILSWSKAAHKGSSFKAALYGYNTLRQASYVSLTVKSQARRLIPFAEKNTRLTDATYKTAMAAIVDTSKSIYTYQEMLSDIQQLKYLYAEAITVESIGKSVLGQDIKAVILGNPNAPKKIMVSASTHAREHMTTTLIMKQLETYLQQYDSGTYGGYYYKDILNQVAIYYVPMLNPDGVTLSQKGVHWISDSNLRAKLINLNGGSTNFSRWKANINGVDINRNFNWGWDKVEGSYGPGPHGYKGPNPESEPETKAIVSYTRKHNFSSVYSYHATGSILYWWYGQQGAVLERDKAITGQLAAMTGYAPVKPDPRISGYAGFGNWYAPTFGGTHFTVEIGRGAAPLKASEFPDIWNRNRLTSIFLAYNNMK